MSETSAGRPAAEPTGPPPAPAVTDPERRDTADPGVHPQAASPSPGPDPASTVEAGAPAEPTGDGASGASRPPGTSRSARRRRRRSAARAGGAEGTTSGGSEPAGASASASPPGTGLVDARPSRSTSEDASPATIEAGPVAPDAGPPEAGSPDAGVPDPGVPDADLGALSGTDPSVDGSPVAGSTTAVPSGPLMGAARHADGRPKIGDTRPAPAQPVRRPPRPAPVPTVVPVRSAPPSSGKAVEVDDDTTPASTATKEGGPGRSRRRSGRERRGRPVGRYLMCVHVRPHATQIAVLEGRTLVEHYVSRVADDATQIDGNIYRGRVQNVLPGMEAAFVDIGTPKNAVLYRGDVRYDRDDIETSSSSNLRIEQMLK